MQFGAYITYKEYLYLDVEADTKEEALEIAEQNLDKASIVGDDDYDIEIEETD